MKSNLTSALIFNLGLLLFSFFIFITKGIDSGFINWKFYASLTGVIGFSIFCIILFIQIKKQ